MNENQNAVEIKYNRLYAVVQANELVRSRQDDLSLLEAKLIRLAISQVIKEEKDFKTYSCEVAQLAQFLGIGKDNIYREIKDISKTLMKKSIFIKGEKDKRGQQEYKIFHWIDYAEYKDGKIIFQLSEHLKPYLLGLEELFTQYDYGALISLPTTYSIRLYELLISWQNSFIRYSKDKRYKKPKNEKNIELKQNEIIFSIDYLREYFNCLDKYPNGADFVKRVIVGATKALQNKSTLFVLCRQVKSGRTITDIIFTIYDWTQVFEYKKDYEEWKKNY